MRTANQVWIGVFITLSTALVGGYVLVTLRGFPTPWVYHSRPNIGPLIFVTILFLLAYNTATQLFMYFWYKYDWANKPYYIQKFFPRALVLLSSMMLLMFMKFVLGLGGASLQTSGYLDVEFVSFLTYFGAFVLLTLRYPLSNPWERIIHAKPLENGEEVEEKEEEKEEQVIVLQHKQETLMLPLRSIPILVFVRKLCLCVCVEGRQLHAHKLNSEGFKMMSEYKNYIRVNRNTFVRQETIEGYISRGRSKYVVFRNEMQQYVDGLIREAEPYIRGKDEKDAPREKIFKISETYLTQVRDMLEKRTQTSA